MNCLNCDIEFTPVRKDIAKFCSTKCRVQHNRNNPKDKVTKVQMQVLYNEMMDMVSKVNSGTNNNPFNLPTEQTQATVTVKSGVHYNTVKSFEYYRAAKKDIELEEDWQKLKDEIEAATNLTPKQKNILLTTNI